MARMQMAVTMSRIDHQDSMVIYHQLFASINVRSNAVVRYNSTYGAKTLGGEIVSHLSIPIQLSFLPPNGLLRTSMLGCPS